MITTLVFTMMFAQVDLSSISGVELALNIAAIDNDAKPGIEPSRPRNQDDEAARRVRDLEKRVKELEQQIVVMKDLIEKSKCNCVRQAGFTPTPSTPIPTTTFPQAVESQRIIRQEPTVFYQYQSAPLYRTECSNGSCRLIRRR